MEYKNKLLLNVEWVDRIGVKPYARNSRRNDDTIEVVARSIKNYGWQQPIVIDNDNIIVAGHSRWKAAELLSHDKVPIVRFNGNEQEAKEYRIADNRIQETSEWDYDILKTELIDLEFDTGFTDHEIKKILGDEHLTEYVEPEIFEVIIELPEEEVQKKVYKWLTEEEGNECRLLSI